MRSYNKEKPATCLKYQNLPARLADYITRLWKFIFCIKKYVQPLKDLLNSGNMIG